MRYGGSMSTPEDISKDTWLKMSRSTRQKIVFLTISANLVGALIVTCYFMFFDEAIAGEQIRETFIVMGIMFIGLVILAAIVSYR